MAGASARLVFAPVGVVVTALRRFYRLNKTAEVTVSRSAVQGAVEACGSRRAGRALRRRAATSTPFVAVTSMVPVSAPGGVVVTALR